MIEEQYTWSATDYDRAGRVIKWAEAAMAQEMRRDAWPNMNQENYTVRVTSNATDANGHYSGIITTFEADQGLWRDWGGTVKVRCPNGEKLVEDVRYDVRGNGQATLSGTVYDLFQLDPGAGSVAIIRTPADGIPALTVVGGKEIPGQALCAVYREQVINGVRQLVPAGFNLLIKNLMTVVTGGSIPGTAHRDFWGTWTLSALGLELAECATDSGSSGSSGSGSSGSGGGPTTGPCFWQGACGAAGVPTGLVGTVTAKTGCFATAPDSVAFGCFNPPGTSGVHRFGCTTAGPNVCAHSITYNNSSIPPPGGRGWYIDVDPAFDPNWPILYLNETPGGQIATPADAGWTCSPASAKFHVNDGAGNTCLVTVVEG